MGFFSLSLLINFTIFAFFCVGPLSSVFGASDTTNFVYKGCANQNFQDPSGAQNLKNLVDTLVSQAADKTFSTITTGDNSSQNAITGLFQCRGDLTTQQCHSCVSKIPSLLNKHCGNAIAARVQLNGCYLKYEIVGFRQVSGTELLYKICGSTKASGTGFEERRDTAFDMATNGVKSGGSSGGGGGGGGGGLFYTGSYQSVYVLSQCEGDLSSGDCGDCVKSGFESAKSECGDSISAQIYLNKCYISFSYYPNGVPRISDDSAPGTRKHAQRTVAIAVGGIAALGFLVVILMFVRSLVKKKRSSSKRHGGGWN